MAEEVSGRRWLPTRSELWSATKRYFSKWRGEAKAGPAKIASPLFIVVSALGGFAALGVMSASVVLAEDLAQVWLVVLGSHGATMVLVFSAPQGPFSQPRNVLLGNLIASLVGVGSRIWVAQPMGNIGLALPLSVTLSYILMHLTKSLNPPAGGTAALAVVSSPEIERVGWKLVIPAVLFGAVFVLVACIFINLIPGQRYPKYWFVDSKTANKLLSPCHRKKDEDVEAAVPVEKPVTIAIKQEPFSQTVTDTAVDNIDKKSNASGSTTVAAV